jgi:hypothetical protein
MMLGEKCKAEIVAEGVNPKSSGTESGNKTTEIESR